MSCMFTACKSLKKLNISKFDLSKVNKIGGMIYDCNILENNKEFKNEILNIERLIEEEDKKNNKNKNKKCIII